MCGQSRVPSALLLRHIIIFTYYFGWSSREHSGHASKIFRSRAHFRAQFTRAMCVNSGTDSNLRLTLGFTLPCQNNINVSSMPLCHNLLKAPYYLFSFSFSYRPQLNCEKRKKKQLLHSLFFLCSPVFSLTKTTVSLFTFERNLVLVCFWAFEI